MQEAALELSLPVVRIGGLAVSRREVTGGGVLSGVVNRLEAQVIARRRVLCSQSSGLVGGHQDGSKMGRLEAVLGQFRRCWGHEVPCLRCFGQTWPRNAIWGVPGRLLGLLRKFLLCRPSIQGVSHFFAASKGLYVGLRGCFQERLLCVFTWVTLSRLANAVLRNRVCGKVMP